MLPLLCWLTLTAMAQEVPVTEVTSAHASLPDAPELAFGYFLSQGPVSEAKDPLLVVELWATWCGPCHKTFPVLSQLQATYGDRIRVIAMTDERTERVRKFVHENRDQMRFAISVGSSDAVQSLMFGGYRGRAIPSVYVMHGGKMLWSGPPNELEAALSTLLSTDR